MPGHSHFNYICVLCVFCHGLCFLVLGSSKTIHPDCVSTLAKPTSEDLKCSPDVTEFDIQKYRERHKHLPLFTSHIS